MKKERKRLKELEINEIINSQKIKRVFDVEFISFFDKSFILPVAINKTNMNFKLEVQIRMNKIQSFQKRTIFVNQSY